MVYPLDSRLKIYHIAMVNSHKRARRTTDRLWAQESMLVTAWYRIASEFNVVASLTD